MYESRKIAVAIPCHDEELLITKVLGTLPDYVDLAVVVDDRSTDQTVAKVREFVPRPGLQVDLVVHEKNQGVGGAIATGYRRSVELGADVVVIVAGDAQMDPADMEGLVAPVARGEADYTKGNRLFQGQSWKLIPKVRYLGNAALSMLTKICSGYWHLADSQCGYTALSADMIRKLDVDKIYKRYGMPNDILIRLNILDARVRDLPVKPVYNVGERSGLRIWKHGPKIAFLLFRGFWRRMFWKYVIIDFHPLIFFYVFGGVMLVAGSGFGMYLAGHRFVTGHAVAASSALMATLLIVTGLQMTLFGMWFDMDRNRHLK
jgi:glycosyltransferase involved in cell wall biosynthesis